MTQPCMTSSIVGQHFHKQHLLWCPTCRCNFLLYHTVVGHEWHAHSRTTGAVVLGSLMMLSAWGIQQGLDTLGQDFLGKSVYLAVITSPMHCKKGIGCWNCWKHVSCWKYSTVVTVPHKKSLHPNQCKGNPLLIVWHEVPCWMSTKEIHHYVDWGIPPINYSTYRL